MARRSASLVLFFFALVPGLTAVFGQAAVQSAPQTNQSAAAVKVDPVMPKDPDAAMQLAARVNGLASVDMKPWHLKANYQTQVPELLRAGFLNGSGDAEGGVVF